jgi:hypothetical protein
MRILATLFVLFLSVPALAEDRPLPPLFPVKVTFHVPFTTFERFDQAPDGTESADKSLGNFGGALWFQPFRRATEMSDSKIKQVLGRVLIGAGFTVNKGASKYFQNFEYNQEIRASFDESRCHGTEATGNYYIDPATGQRVYEYRDTWGECFQCSDLNGLCYNRPVNSRIDEITYSPGSIDIVAQIPFEKGAFEFSPLVGWVANITKTGIIDNNLKTGVANQLVLGGSAEWNPNGFGIGVEFDRGVVGNGLKNRFKVKGVVAW